MPQPQAKTNLPSLRCALCAARIQGQPLWVTIEDERYPVDDATCAELLGENPVAALGPRVELFYRPGCPNCQAKVALWQEAQERRPLRLNLRPESAGTPCPRLFLGGQEDNITLAIDDLEELLLWLWIRYPGFAGCC